MSSQASSLSAASRRAPSLSTLTEENIINGADPAQETPTPPAAGKGRGLLDKLKKPEKIDLTPLHCNIPVTLNEVLKYCMKQGIEKTAIVVEALTPVLEPYRELMEMEDAAKTNQA